MNIVAYEELLSRYFFIHFFPRNFDEKTIRCFEENENKVFSILKQYVSKDCSTFDIERFVKNENDYFGLLPNEIKSVSKESLSLMINEFEERGKNILWGFIQICLDTLYDRRFREEFKKKSDEFLKFDDVDIVKDFLNLCSENYGYYDFSIDKISDKPLWNFSNFTDVREIGQRKAGVETEKVNNLFSGYKLFGQGEYSKLLIVYRNWSKKSLIELRKLGVGDILINDDEISNNFFADSSVEKIIAIDKFLHSRFSGDYVPYELNGKYNSVYPNKTLREEIIDICKYNDPKKEDDDELPWNLDQCQKIKELFIKQLEINGFKKCKEITANHLFDDYDYEELNSKEKLRKHKISIKTLYELLKKFDDNGLLKDGRSEVNGLQSFEEIKNAYLLHQRDNPVSEKDENEKSLFEAIDDKKYTDFEEKIRSDIDNESGGICGFLIQKIKGEFKNNYSLMSTLKNCCEKFNTEPEQILYQSVDNEVIINRFEIVKNAIKKIDKSYLRKFEEFFDKEKLENIKICLSMYEESSSIGWKTYSLQNILNLDKNKLIEKIWFCILFESLRGFDKNPWREFVSTRYLNGAFTNEEKKYVAGTNKQSMNRIYESLLNY